VVQLSQINSAHACIVISVVLICELKVVNSVNSAGLMHHFLQTTFCLIFGSLDWFREGSCLLTCVLHMLALNISTLHK
jgi:hypothetical protein